MSRSTVVVWFRRDLRVDDHPALMAAVAEANAVGGQVTPVFVVEPGLAAAAAVNRCRFIAGCVDALDAELDGHLVLRTGPAAVAVPRLAAEVGARLVFVTSDHAPTGVRRDRAVELALAEAGRRLVAVGSPYAVAPGSVRTAAGRPFAVFTPFRRAWEAHGWPEPTGRPRSVRFRDAPSDVAIAALGGVGRGTPATVLPAAGPGPAAVLLERFLDDALDTYARDRDRPDRAGTSRLSPYLRFGCLHPRQVLAGLADRSAPTGPRACGPLGERGSGAAGFTTELAWREFYADVLAHHPRSAWEPVVAAGRYLRVDTGPEADRRFTAWSTGRTGFPLVDAGMRQLLAEGWVHNRVRMVAASLLVKDLHLDWRRGARWFLDHLFDGDVASNNHGWQWVAGTGTDAAPFHRVFNPVLQRARFDPDGTYVRRYVPEVDAFGYPEPIVDHAAERAEALARWAEARRAAAAEETERR